MGDMDGETSIGTNIRRIRHWRGLSLEVVAGLAGFSAGHLSRIENGKRRVDRRSTLSAIAGALRVSLVDLTGGGLAIREPEADGTLPAIRAALLDTALDEPRTPTRPLAELGAQARRARELRRSCRYA
ncbi:MAG: helix-turn-helix domain-containing protein, partial [Sciscionella sp.]